MVARPWMFSRRQSQPHLLTSQYYHSYNSFASQDSLSSPEYHFQRRATCPTLLLQHDEGGSEADDERSSVSSISSFGLSDMGSIEHGRQVPVPSYPGEDTRPTSRRELLGFYVYSFAAEVFVVCGLGAFIPITLEDLARASSTAVLAHDRTKSCKAHGIERSLSDTATTIFTRHNENSAKGGQCVFRILGMEINTASFAMYTFSLSVLLQALLVVTMSGAADHGKYRKSLMIGFAVVGAVATMLFLPVTPKVFLFGSLFAAIGNICFGASFVLLNSFLPLLVRWYPLARVNNQERQPLPEQREEAYEEDPNDDYFGRSDESMSAELVDSTAALLPNDNEPYPPSRAAPSAAMQLSTKISSYGVGIGYLAAVLVQVISIFILRSTGSNLFSLRLVLFVIGGWWLAFTVPAAFLLRSRPGPPLSAGKTRSWLGYITYSWKNLYKTMLRARRLKDVLLFLTAWFMISDAIATVSGTAILFAKTTLGMDSSALALINVIVTIAGITGAFTWSKFSRVMQLKPSHTILTCICLFELIPLYGLLGYIPAIQLYGTFGLQQPWEMYPVGAVYGLVLGGLSSYCRSLYGELIPPGSEAAFFALFAITDKGSSVFGPAIVGAITDATGEIRPAFWFLLLLIGLPIPLLYAVDVDRGKREGAKLARDTAPEDLDLPQDAFSSVADDEVHASAR